jgi:hypothetical protein
MMQRVTGGTAEGRGAVIAQEPIGRMEHPTRSPPPYSGCAPTLPPSSSDTPWSSTAAKRCSDAPRVLKPDGHDRTGAGHRMLGVTCDVSSEDQVAAMVDRAVGTFGKLDMAFKAHTLRPNWDVLSPESHEDRAFSDAAGVSHVLATTPTLVLRDDLSS